MGKVRGVNCVGKGPWSEVSAGVKPLRVPSNVEEVRSVPGNGEVSLFWNSEDVLQRDVCGWFEVQRRPPSYSLITRRRQCRFGGVANAQKYKFRINGVNGNGGRSRYLETVEIAAQQRVNEKLYANLRQKTARDMDAKNKRVKNIKKGNMMSAQQMFQQQIEKQRKKKGTKEKEKGKKSKKKGKNKGQKKEEKAE